MTIRRHRVLLEGTPLDRQDVVATRRYLPHALLATAIVIVLPALVVIPLSPLDGAADLLLSALLATGLSVAAGSVCSALWTKRPGSSDVVFGDLMLWVWLRRVRAERHLAEGDLPVRGEEEHSGDVVSDPLLPALRRLATVVDARDSHTDGHTRRVTRHARRIARRMGLPADEVAKIEIAASLHDVGKVGIPRSILANLDNLTADEQAMLERHAAEGADMVAELRDPEISAIVRYHHERLDGSGYPEGLAGADIPVGARIVAVADAFDELTSASRGEGAQSPRNALDSLAAQSGSKLDPAAVSAFLGYYSGTRSIAGVAFVATVPQRAVRWLASAPAVLGTSAPPLAQGVCAAGAVAIAGVCLSGTPTVDGGDRPGSATERPAATAVAGESTTVADRALRTTDGDRAEGKKRADGKDDSGSRPQRGGSQPGQPGGGDSPTGDGAPPRAGSPGGGSGDSSPATSPTPGQSSGPVEIPEVDAPDLPSTPAPAPIVDALVDQVNDTLDPLPTEELLAPVQQVLSPLLGKK